MRSIALATVVLTCVGLSTVWSMNSISFPNSQAPKAKCFSFYAIGSTTKTGLRNTCDSCMVAVANFVYSGQRHEEKEFKVQGHSSMEIDTSGTMTVELIDQKVCGQH